LGKGKGGKMGKIKDTTKILVNKKMSNATYEQRRKVMSLLYHAKNLVPALPRITVRITSDHEEILGCARLGQNIIWIAEKATVSRAVVYHEILHAVLGINHIEKCPLMASRIDSNLGSATCDFLFIQYFRHTKFSPFTIKEQK
jgi:hypothetical protein